MLGDLLRRLLWLPPVVVLVSALTFELVMDGPATAASPYGHLPRFFNSDPADVTTVARGALAALRAGDDRAAAAEISRLGGAALPVVLPELSGLPVPARGRVLSALRPVGERVGVRGASTDEEELLWRRFWEERSFDFLEPSVRRAVRRYVQSPTEARLREVEALDTAALAELFVAIGPDGPLPDPRVASVVVPVLQRALGGLVKPGDDRGAEVLALRSYWFAHRIEFVALDGPRRAVALLLETQYGKLVQRAVLDRTVEARQGRSPLRLLLRRGRSTLGRVLGGAALGALGGWALVWLGRGAGWARSLGAAALPLAALSLWLGEPGVGWELLLFVAASVLLLIERSAARWGAVEARGAVARAALGRGASEGRFWLRSLLGRAPSLFFLGLGECFSEALLLVLLAEWRWRLPGLGSVIIDAVRERDATTLVSLSVASAVAVQASLSLAEALALRHDPRLGAR